MPRTKNALSRYKILDELLSDRYHCYTLDSLTEIVGERLMDLGQDPVSRRQIEKDIQYLEYGGEFLAEIERYTADGEACFNKKLMKTVWRKGLRYADPSYSIFKKNLTEDEKNLMRDLLSIVGQFDGLPELATLEDMRMRLQLGEATQTISLSQNPLDGTNTFGVLYSSITHHQVVKLTYHTRRDNGQKKMISVSPYQLREYNRRWFLICSAKEDGKILTFAVDQIDDVEQRPTDGYVNYEGDINERYEDVVGVTLYEDKPVEHIIFWVSDESKNYVQTKPIHESQKNIRGENAEHLYTCNKELCTGAFFSIDCIVNYELVRELMGFGKDLLVLQPLSLRQEIIRKISENLQAYR